MHLQLKTTLAAIAASLLTGCALLEISDSDEPSLSAACLVFAPLSASANDTTETIRQIVQHNAAREIICGE